MAAESMTPKQNPFSLYDFLGYLIPGAVFGYSVVGFWGLGVKYLSPAQTIHQYLGFNRSELYVPLTILAYILGHLLSFVSSVTVERYALRQLGYPSHYLLGFNQGAYRRAEPETLAYRIIHVLADCLLLPITLPEQILSRLGMRDRYAKPLDPLLAGIVGGKVDSLLRTHGGVEPTEYQVRLPLCGRARA